MRKYLIYTAFALLLSSAAYLSEGSDPLAGTWKFNPQKSKMNLNLPPRALTRRYESRGAGLYIFTQEGRGADGSNMHSMYVAREDGQDYPLIIENADELSYISFKVVDANTVEQTQKLGTKIVFTATRTVSKDGKTMTLTVKARGQN